MATYYVSTRGEAPEASFRDVLLAGLAPDGGLYVPAAWPRLAAGEVARLDPDDFPAIVAEAVGPFAADWIDAATLGKLAAEAYAGFDDPGVVAPLTALAPDLYLLELFHGPTLAFKDVAMQLLARLFSRALAETGRTLTIIGATSGDTGGAAVRAFAGAPGVELVILYPHGRISEVQRRFMTTETAPNVRVLAVDGAFDACQSIVKALFADRAFAAERRLSGVNSINWVRLAIQTAYYFSAAATLRRRGETRPPVFSVPTGNFGDAFAGHVARRMGLETAPLRIAVNENDILHRALTTGLYAPNEAVMTDAPSMDIEVASNFERALFEASARDPSAVRSLMADLRTSGAFRLSQELRAALGRDFVSDRVDQTARREAMRRWSDRGVLLDPHSAVAVVAAERAIRAGIPGPHVALATAHPAKVPEAVHAATGRVPALAPATATGLDGPERFVRVAASVEAVKAAMR